MIKKICILILISIIFICTLLIIVQTNTEKKQELIIKDIKKIAVSNDDINVENFENNIESNIKNNVENNIKEETIVENQIIDLKKLYNINQDIIGWIKIDGTNINYPVMQNETFYIDKDFYKNYSTYGTPFLSKYCNLDVSDNLIIYGHHMKNGKMFQNLEKYKNKNFYDTHKHINFYVLKNDETILNNYEIVFVFKTVAYSEDGFKYYYYYNLKNKLEFEEFISNCKKLELYDTNENVEFGDKFLTLSTCEYSQKNGRMIIVAKKI